MSKPSFRFEDFVLDPADRRLCRGETAVELNGRYLDALILLVSEAGKLVSKDRFMDEVWRGIPVTDEALTQCIRTLRRQLGDDAARPRFIETVPKFGYRFVAPVAEGDEVQQPETARKPQAVAPTQPWQRFLLLGAAGTIGGGVAGIFGGLFYGFGAASQALQPGMGAMSVLLVLVCLTIALGLIGGAGVAFGIAAAGLVRLQGWWWSAAGGALGGLITGAFAKLLGLDAFNLLLGQAPGDITGAGEGALLGGAVGLGAWAGAKLSGRGFRRSIAAAALIGGMAGALVPVLGGRLLGGSLDTLARVFPGSRLRLNRIGALFGEDGLGPVSHVITAALEGLLFAAFVVGGMLLARRSIDTSR